jgi:hypothetical protein
MRLYPSKWFIFIYFFVLGLITIVLTFHMDIFTFQSTKDGLKLLYEAEFKNCMIKNVVEAKYPSAGYYKQFQVDCNTVYYPVLMENMNIEKESSFKKGVFVNKKKNDYLIIINDSQNSVTVSARHIENEIGLGPIVRVMIITLLILVPIVLFFIPDQYFKKK